MGEHRGETFVMAEEGQLTFTTFLLGLSSTALIHLGVAPNPETGTSQIDLTGARQSIDLLALLHDKTKGNLTDDEAKLFHALLTDLRVRFVQQQASKKA